MSQSLAETLVRHRVEGERPKHGLLVGDRRRAVDQQRLAGERAGAQLGRERVVAARVRPGLPARDAQAVGRRGVLALAGVLVDVLRQQVVDVGLLLDHADELVVVGEQADPPLGGLPRAKWITLARHPDGSSCG